MEPKQLFVKEGSRTPLGVGHCTHLPLAFLFFHAGVFLHACTRGEACVLHSGGCRGQDTPAGTVTSLIPAGRLFSPRGGHDAEGFPLQQNLTSSGRAFHSARVGLPETPFAQPAPSSSRRPTQGNTRQWRFSEAWSPLEPHLLPGLDPTNTHLHTHHSILLLFYFRGSHLGYSPRSTTSNKKEEGSAASSGWPASRAPKGRGS